MNFDAWNRPCVFVRFQFPAAVSFASFLQSHAGERWYQIARWNRKCGKCQRKNEFLVPKYRLWYVWRRALSGHCRTLPTSLFHGKPWLDVWKANYSKSLLQVHRHPQWSKVLLPLLDFTSLRSMLACFALLLYRIWYEMSISYLICGLVYWTWIRLPSCCRQAYLLVISIIARHKHFQKADIRGKRQVSTQSWLWDPLWRWWCRPAWVAYWKILEVKAEIGPTRLLIRRLDKTGAIWILKMRSYQLNFSAFCLKITKMRMGQNDQQIEKNDKIEKML